MKTIVRSKNLCCRHKKGRGLLTFLKLLQGNFSVIVEMFTLLQFQKNISQELNSEDVFEREIKLYQDFCYYEETTNVKISFNVSSEGATIWVYYNDNQSAERGTRI